MSDRVCENTDKVLWRKEPISYYSPSIHVTENGMIGIEVGGHVIVSTVESWHNAGEKLFCVNPDFPSWRWRLAMKLLRWEKKP